MPAQTRLAYKVYDQAEWYMLTAKTPQPLSLVWRVFRSTSRSKGVRAIITFDSGMCTTACRNHMGVTVNELGSERKLG